MDHARSSFSVMFSPNCSESAKSKQTRACWLSDSTTRMSRQMLSACTGSFNSRYRSARSSAAGTASADNFLNSNCISILSGSLKQHLQHAWFGCARKSTFCLRKRHRVGNHISDIDLPRSQKSDGRLKSSTPRTNEGHFIHDYRSHVDVRAAMRRRL